MATWLETYARSLDLPIWMSSKATHAEYDNQSGLWNVTVLREGCHERVFQVRHYVVATGILGGKPKMPHFHRREVFSGQVMHAWQYKRPNEFFGKKVVVVGAGSTGTILKDSLLHYN